MTRRSSILFILVFLAGCDGSPPKGEGWKVVGHLSDGLQAQFVEVASDKVQNRATYNDAITILCPQREICVLGFFSPGDRIPATQSAKEFFDSGGWKNFPVLAVWWSNRSSGVADFTTWDCERAGATGAPLEALCGAGIREAYGAVLAIGGRTGMAEACHWPSSDGPAVAATYMASISDVKRREQFQRGYDQQYSGARRGPDNPDDCRRLRPKIEEKTKQARSMLKLARK